jgi:hypothetical protein
MHEEFQKKVKEISEEWVNVSWKHHEIAKKLIQIMKVLKQ